MPVVCSFSHVAATNKYLQQENSTLSPPIREVRNEKELTKSASVIDPATLLSPTNHDHPKNTTRGTTSTRTPHYSSRCNRWKKSRCREPGISRYDCLSQRHTRSAQCAVRTQPLRTAVAVVFRAPAYAHGAKVKARRPKRSQITKLLWSSALVLSRFFLFLFFRHISICVCAVSIFS